MKKIISFLIAMSMTVSLATINAAADDDENIQGMYTDTEAQAIPENLITDSNVINVNLGNCARSQITGAEVYTQTKYNAKPWNIFPAGAIKAKISGGKHVNLDSFKAGTTYVFKANVKNMSEDTTLIPNYGIAIAPRNQYSYDAAKGSDTYGKIGMPVTSAEWMEFKDTITFPITWKETSKDTVTCRSFPHGGL